mmetsp:Transcript_8588/g.22170  ORF Transcript_8588/g.22170 Transcript_8588/m.22170 type:complete len:302 (-) Transcript_8588:2155-3060(-)
MTSMTQSRLMAGWRRWSRCPRTSRLLPTRQPASLPRSCCGCSTSARAAQWAETPVDSTPCLPLPWKILKSLCQRNCSSTYLGSRPPSCLTGCSRGSCGAIGTEGSNCSTFLPKSGRGFLPWTTRSWCSPEGPPRAWSMGGKCALHCRSTSSPLATRAGRAPAQRPTSSTLSPSNAERSELPMVSLVPPRLRPRKRPSSLLWAAVRTPQGRPMQWRSTRGSTRRTIPSARASRCSSGYQRRRGIWTLTSWCRERRRCGSSTSTQPTLGGWSYRETPSRTAKRGGATRRPSSESRGRGAALTP